MNTQNITLNSQFRRRGRKLTAVFSAICAPGLFAAAIAVFLAAPARAGHDCDRPEQKPIEFAVLSDTHLYDNRLGTTGSAFEAYLAADPKLLALSEPILDSVLNDLLKSHVKFVIISGDLTKDGEVESHLLMVRHLERLERAGIQVYVVPGNHDINNHDAVSFSGDTTNPVATVTPHFFKALYHRFGYGQAIFHAPDSLSYVAEPAPGVWLLALDSVKWSEDVTAAHPIVSGRLTEKTLAWAQEKIKQGRAHGKKVIAFMHHGVNMHFLSEPQIFPDYLIDNWPTVGAKLAGAGLEVIFTGHYHSQDASNLTVDANGNPTSSTLTDIETGSLVLAPCPYRIATLDRAGKLHVESRRVTEIKADLGGVSFQDYADNFARTLLPYQVDAELEQLFGLPQQQADAVAPLVVDALMANYAGDETPSEETMATLQALLSYPPGTAYNTLGQLLGTLWIDPGLSDNTVDVDLSAK